MNNKTETKNAIIVPNLVGYMLGNNDHVVAAGEPWFEHPDYVWVCMDLEMAKNILRASHTNSTNRGPVWTTIYRVFGENIKCTPGDNRRMFTRQADKIIVGSPVHYEEPNPATNRQVLLRRVASMRRNGLFRHYAEEIKAKGK